VSDAGSPFTLSHHARGQIEDREIEFAWIARAMFQSERTEPDRDDPELGHALARIPEVENRVLRVVYNQTVMLPRNVTVSFDRGQRNRL
jgi:hypothetical protein